MSIEMMLIFFVVIILFRESFLYGYCTSNAYKINQKSTFSGAFVFWFYFAYAKTMLVRLCE